VFSLIPFLGYSQNEDWFFNSVDSISAGIEMHNREAYDSAIALYDQIHSGDTNYAWAQYEKCFSLSSAGRHEEALELARINLKTSNSYATQFYILIGNSLDDLEKSQEAQAIYDSAIVLFPGSEKLYYNRAVLHLRKERWKQAIDDLKKAIELNPFHASSHYQLANLALNNGNHTQALLSLGYYFLAEPASGRTNAILQYFNDALSEKTTLKPIDYQFDPEGTYTKSDRLIKSYAALRDAYDVSSKSSFPLVKQMHLAYNQVAKIKGKEDFWAMYYLPFYQAMVGEEQFEAFSYLLCVSIQNDYYQDLAESHMDMIRDQISWSSGFIVKHHGLHPLGYTKGAELAQFYFHKGTNGISGRGSVDKDNNPTGVYEFYYTSGAVSSRGEMNENGNEIGEHRTYFSNGQLQQVALYKDGMRDGRMKEYYVNGVLFLEAGYKNNKLDGPATLYHQYGPKSKELFFKEGILVDTLSYYHNNGQLSSKIPHQQGKGNGLAIYFNEDGSLLSKINLKDDIRTGPAEFYYPNGQLDTKLTYNDKGEITGPYESYYSNGQLIERGDYLENIQIGNWNTYNPEGKLIREVNFDERGKKSGIEISYDAKGRKTEMYRYKREEFVYFENYDTTGAVIASGEEKRGKINFKKFNLNGTLMIDGVLNENYRIGEWKEYDSYGNLERKLSYSDDGKLENEAPEYFTESGEISGLYNYRNDTLHGPYIRYYSNGEIAEMGTYYKGSLNGIVNSYYPDGAKKSIQYYLNGSRNGEQNYYNSDGSLDRKEKSDKGILAAYKSYLNDSLIFDAKYEDPREPILIKFPNGKTSAELSRTGGQYQGKAQWFHGNGQLSTNGFFIDNKKDGKWTNYFPNGQIKMLREYHLDKPVGTWEEYWPNGQIDEVYQYLEGELHGPNKEYNESGILTDVLNYYLGKIDGDRYFYSEEGDLQHIRVYDLGTIIGWKKVKADGTAGEFVPLKEGSGKVKALYPNGKAAREYELINGDFGNSVYRSYYSSGQLEQELHYKNGDYFGIQKYYYPDGQTHKEINYEAGLKHGVEKHYHANGQLAKVMNWAWGELFGNYTEYNEKGQKLNEYLYSDGDLYEEL
tara:strand:- start:4673 stop:7936 length:3264 start_codon:yes stop_codon:yes gene_type:complete